MNRELEYARIEFNNKARRVFFLLYDNFKVSSGKLSRRLDENVFQQQQSKYLRLLKQELDYYAKELVDNFNTVENSHLLNKILLEEINGYMNEFKQKSEAI